MQLRGVREIFSTLRENLDQVLGGLDDGLLLFSLERPGRDGQSRANDFWPCPSIIFWAAARKIFSLRIIR